VLQLPAVRLPAKSIEALEPGEILSLDLSSRTLGEWRVGGQHIADAHAVRQGSRRAARLGSETTKERT